MNRTTRTIVVVGIAVLVAAVASLGAYQAIKRMPVREVEVHIVFYVVASHDMPMGSRITKDYVKLVAWPASSPVPKGFTSIESVLNRGLIDSVVENEPLTESKLAALEAGAGLPPVRAAVRLEHLDAHSRRIVIEGDVTFGDAADPGLRHRD